MSWVRRLATLPVRFYRRFLSPLKPPTCRFHPTCSAYAVEAIEAHGVLKGALLSTWRLLRCQPFARGGWDPVPSPGAWRPEPSATPSSLPEPAADAPAEAPHRPPHR